MEIFVEICNNPLLVVPLLTCLVAQVVKVMLDVITNRTFSFRFLVSPGGMPSSHSALVGSLATGVGQTMGWSSTEFAIACIFAIIVMYDAAGVRQAAGKQARILNQIMEEFIEHEDFSEEKLKELLGHTPIQVFVGLIVGILSSAFLLPLVSK